VACFTAYFFSGHSGIYSAQKIAIPKIFDEFYADEASLAEANKRRGYIHQKFNKYRLPFEKKENE